MLPRLDTELSPRTEADLRLQAMLDRERERYDDALTARMRSALIARSMLRRKVAGAEPAYRQALIDLASWCATLADELEPPSVCRVNGHL